MSISLLFLIVSISFLALLSIIFRIEDAREGRLLCCVFLRKWLDYIVERLCRLLACIRIYFGKSSIRLILHYFVHKILKIILSGTSILQKKIENILRQNKQIAKKIRNDKEKTYFDEIVEHKKETALTEQQKKKLRSHE